MITLIDYILDLFRSPNTAAAFVTDPEQAMRDAGLPNVSAAQLQAVAATAAPAGALLGGGDPVVGLQRAVADHHQMAQNFASPLSPQANFAPQRTFAPETNTDFASHNSTDLASHNNTELLSPDQNAGANSQVGGFNLGFGDITLGNKTSQTATDGGVVVGGDSSGAVTTGHDNVVGDGNEVVKDIWTGDGSPVTVGHGNEIDASSQKAGGDIVQDNEGPVIKDIDMSGGNSAGGSAHGGGLFGHGSGGDSAGGSGGSIIIDATKTSAVGGNQTTTQVGGPLSGGVESSDNAGQNNSVVHSIDSSVQDNSVVDSSHTVDTHYSVDTDYTANTAVDNSHTVDTTIDNSHTTQTNVEVGHDVDAGLF